MSSQNINIAIINKEKASLYGSVFNNSNGSLLIDDLIAFSCYHGDPFVPGDPCVTAYNCGQRRVVSRILNLLGKGHALELIKQKNERLAIDE